MMSCTINQGCIGIFLLLLCLSYTTGVELLPYGPEAGDNEWEGVDDSKWTKIDFQEHLFPFGGVSRDYIYISENGNMNYENFTTNNISPSSKWDLIGALLDDLDIGNNSHLYYRETMDTDILYKASLYVKQIHGVDEFWPTWAFVVSWIDFAVYGEVPADLRFQIVLVSDGNTSYVLYLYNRLNNEVGAKVLVTGYNETSDVAKFDTLCPFPNITGAELVLQKQSSCQRDTGVISFRTDMIDDLGICRETFDDSGCSSNSDCATHCPLCNTATGNCVECQNDGHCAHNPDKKACDTSVGWCATCTTDAHCSDPKQPHCDPRVRMCKECVFHRHCDRDPYRICTADFHCIECLENRDCRDITKPICEAQTCVCRTDKKPCNGPGMTCGTGGRCECSDGYYRNGGGCSLDNCPFGSKAVALHGCARPGRLGGTCVRGRCLERNVSCNRRTNRCVCRGRCRPKVICHNRK